MKLRSVLLFSAGITILTVTVGLGIGLLLADHQPWMVVTAFVCTMLLIPVPAMACLMVANVSFNLEGPDGRRFLRRLVYVVAGIQLLGVLGLVLVAIAAPDSAGYLVGVVVLSIVLLWSGIRLGMRFQQRLVDESAEHRTWASWPRSRVRRAILRVVVVFTIASMVGSGAILVLGLTLGEGDGLSPGSSIIYGLSLGCFAASIACLVLAWPLVKDMRRVLGRDHATQKAIVRVVLRNKNDPLSEDAQDKAAAYAGIMAVYYPFQIAQLTLLFGGLWLQQVWNLPDGPSDPLYPVALGLVIGLPLLVLISLPIIIRECRRARRYARDHPERCPCPVKERR